MSNWNSEFQQTWEIRNKYQHGPLLSTLVLRQL